MINSKQQPSEHTGIINIHLKLTYCGNRTTAFTLCKARCSSNLKRSRRNSEQTPARPPTL